MITTKNAAIVTARIILQPHFVNGLVEAQGCFDVKIKAVSKDNSTDIIITPSFFILQGNISREIILQLPNFFNTKQTYIRKESQASSLLRYEIENVDDLLHHICPHFDQYPLLSEKKSDSLLFKQVLDILQKEKKPGKKSLLQVIELVYQMNLSSANDKSSKKKPIEHWLEIIENHY